MWDGGAATLRRFGFWVSGAPSSALNCAAPCGSRPRQAHEDGEVRQDEDRHQEPRDQKHRQLRHHGGVGSPGENPERRIDRRRHAEADRQDQVDSPEQVPDESNRTPAGRLPSATIKATGIAETPTRTSPHPALGANGAGRPSRGVVDDEEVAEDADGVHADQDRNRNAVERAPEDRPSAAREWRSRRSAAQPRCQRPAFRVRPGRRCRSRQARPPRRTRPSEPRRYQSGRKPEQAMERESAAMTMAAPAVAVTAIKRSRVMVVSYLGAYARF